MSHFRDNFWENDISSVRGFEVLFNGIKEGNKHTDDITSFIKKRCVLEELYAKELRKLADNFNIQTKSDTLRRSWATLISETQTCADNHSRLAQQLESRRKVVDEFIADQRNKRSNIKKQIITAQDQKRNCFKLVEQAKDMYHKLCKEAESTQNQYLRIKGTSKDGAAKLKVKVEKLQEQAADADQKYKKSLQELESARCRWEREMEKACDLFERMERERIEHIRNELWVYSNQCVQNTVKDSECYHRSLDSLEQCDSSKDLLTFIKNRQTGSTKPSPISYESFYMPRGTPTIQHR